MSLEKVNDGFEGDQKTLVKEKDVSLEEGKGGDQFLRTTRATMRDFRYVGKGKLGLDFSPIRYFYCISNNSAKRTAHNSSWQR